MIPAIFFQTKLKTYEHQTKLHLSSGQGERQA